MINKLYLQNTRLCSDLPTELRSLANQHKIIFSDVNSIGTPCQTRRHLEEMGGTNSSSVILPSLLPGPGLPSLPPISLLPPPHVGLLPLEKPPPASLLPGQQPLPSSSHSFVPQQATRVSRYGTISSGASDGATDYENEEDSGGGIGSSATSKGDGTSGSVCHAFAESEGLCVQRCAGSCNVSNEACDCPLTEAWHTAHRPLIPNPRSVVRTRCSSRRSTVSALRSTYGPPASALHPIYSKTRSPCAS